MSISRRSSHGGAVVEMVLVTPILLLIIGGSLRFLLGAWTDVWRAHRYGSQVTETVSTTVELELLPIWAAPADRRVGRLHLEERAWNRGGKEIWKEIGVRREQD